MNEDDAVNWLYEKVATTLNESHTMGDIEKAIDKQSMEMRRRVLERLSQDIASRTAFNYPKCKRSLNVVDHNRKRVVASSFGKMCYIRSYGCCTSCQKHFAPADIELDITNCGKIVIFC